MKISKEQLEQREDELAEQEYQMSYADLPGDIKTNIHNAVLDEFGMRRNFKFKCLDCGKSFEEEIEGVLLEIYTEVQSETHLEILESVCQPCQRNKEIEEELALWK